MMGDESLARPTDEDLTLQGFEFRRGWSSGFNAGLAGDTEYNWVDDPSDYVKGYRAGFKAGRLSRTI